MEKVKKYLKGFYKTDYGKIITIVVSILIILSLYFRFIGPIPLSISQVTTEKQTAFNVQAEGKVVAVPDTATISLGVQINKPTVEEAQKEANEKINNVTKELKKIGIGDNDIKTSDYRIYPNYNYRSGRKIDSYNINIRLEVKVKDFEKISEVIDKATALGANQIGDLEFIIDDEKLEELKMEAREKAIKKAKKKAEQIARAGGLRIGKLINIVDQENSPYQPRPTLFRASGSALQEDEVEQTQIQPGESEITILVTLSYETL